MSEKIMTVTVAEVYSEPEAEIIKSVLASHEIKAVAMGNAGLQQWRGIMATFQIVVTANDAERAREVVDAYFEGNLEE